MDTFFTYLKKALVLTIFVVFGFAATYIPQPHNHVPEAYAGGLGGQATEFTQQANNALLGTNVGNTAATAASSAVTALSTGSLWLKENVLDGIGWAIAKRIVSAMVRSLIDWINSGFQGKPQFMSDLKGFLLNVADEAIGGFIQELGGIGSFICSPFRLDAQISVALQYQQARSNNGAGQSAPTCTLSGIFNNIEGFISGTFSEGGWNDWLDITSQPEVYTPYGSVLSAQIDARARLINAQGQELTLLDWGDGFLSGKICQAVEGQSGSSQSCEITKPGRIIADQLNKALGAGQDALIEADEINELIAALLGQLANKAMTGIAGLLGLSGGNDYSYSGYDEGSYLDQMVADQTDLATDGSSNATAREIMADALAVQEDFTALAEEYIPRFTQVILTTQSADRRAEAQRAREEAEDIILTTEGATGTIATLESLIDQYDDPITSTEERQDLLIEFTRLDIYSEVELEAAEAGWPVIVR